MPSTIANMLQDNEEKCDPLIPHTFCTYSINLALQYASSKDYMQLKYYLKLQSNKRALLQKEPSIASSFSREKKGQKKGIKSDKNLEPQNLFSLLASDKLCQHQHPAHPWNKAHPKIEPTLLTPNPVTEKHDLRHRRLPCLTNTIQFWKLFFKRTIPTLYILPKLHTSTITHIIPKKFRKIQPTTSNGFPHTNTIGP